MVRALSGLEELLPLVAPATGTPDFSEGAFDGDLAGNEGIATFSRSFVEDAAVGSMKLMLFREEARDTPGDVMDIAPARTRLAQRAMGNAPGSLSRTDKNVSNGQFYFH
tara:strand:- start:24325 stop:24651 length:327 start_codon:yes stop_codon:yes gene_type:complete